MTDFTPARLAELRAVAEGATNSAWEQDDDITEAVCATWNGQHWYMDAVHEEDAAHIATFDPPTVLALLAALEAANEGKQGADLTSSQGNESEPHKLSDIDREELELLGIRYESVLAVLDGYDQLANALEAKTAALERVKALHECLYSDSTGGPVCAACVDSMYDPDPWPCRTIQAIEGTNA